MRRQSTTPRIIRDMMRRSNPQPNSLRVSSRMLVAQELRFDHCQTKTATTAAASIIRHAIGRTEKWERPLAGCPLLAFPLGLLVVLVFLLVIDSLGERLLCLDLYHKGQYHRPALGLFIIKSIQDLSNLVVDQTPLRGAGTTMVQGSGD